VPFEAVKLLGLNTNEPPGATLTLMFPAVFGGADGTAATAGVDGLGDGSGGAIGAPYCGVASERAARDKTVSERSILIQPCRLLERRMGENRRVRDAFKPVPDRFSFV